MVADSQNITPLLHRWQRGEEEGLHQLIPAILGELRDMARHYLSRETSEHTLQPTALVSEVYLRLVGNKVGRLGNRVQFFAFAARLMREILVDHARAQRALKRGGDVHKEQLADARDVEQKQAVDVTTLLAVHQALTRLEEIDSRQRQVVELRYFCGLNLDEIGEVLGMSRATVERLWSAARRWLAREVRG